MKNIMRLVSDKELELDRHTCKICLYCEFIISGWSKFESHLKECHKEEIK